MNRRTQRESFWLGFIAAGLVSFVLVLVGSRLLLPSEDNETTTSPTAQGTEDLATSTGGEEPTSTSPGGGPPPGRGPGSAGANSMAFGTASATVLEAFDAGGCVACHSIKGVGGDGATVGPPLFRTGAIAADRRPGPSVEAYIEESITDPDAFIMPNCPTGPCPSGVMPQTFAESLTADQIQTIVDYLSLLGTASEAEVLNP